MSELVILSGKGGTGKTSLTAAFVELSNRLQPNAKIVLVDADVDAANLDLILSPKILETKEFFGGSIAVIDAGLCTGCGICMDVCRFDAVHENDGIFGIDRIACEGCAACLYQCSLNAISLKEQLAGEWYCSEISAGTFFHAQLKPAQENSGKLVALIKEKARAMYDQGGYDLMLVDGPPGTGCPVISSLSGADAVLIVTEPTVAGAHDLKRALAATTHFRIKTFVCINKYDLYPAGMIEIQNICETEKVKILGEIPFDLNIPRAMIQGKPVNKAYPDSSASKALEVLWKRLNRELINLTGDSYQLLELRKMSF